MKKSFLRAEKRTRGWVKNAVIVFLSVMLILTFFSNTIMNRTLPEVTAQYPQSAAIVTKIRGSGTVEASQTYNVIVSETRTVSSVEVKAGDVIKAGDPLLTLAERESQELTAARASLAALELEYKKLQVNKGRTNHAEAANIQQLRQAVASAQADLERAQTYEAERAELQKQVTAAQNTLTEKNQAKAAADSSVASIQNQIAAVQNSNEEYLSAKERAANNPEDAEALAEVQRIYDEQIAPKLAELNEQLLSAQSTAETAASEVAAAQAALESAQTALSQHEAAASAPSVSSARSALDAANAALAGATAAAQDAASQQGYDAAIAQLELDAKAEELTQAKELVETLEKEAGAANVTSPYPGTVQSVNIAAGDTTSPDNVLITVELTEKGYLMKASVTKEQARVLREGMTADITNLWNTDLEMTLESITADPENANAGRLLAFRVQGEDVTIGQQLSFSVGDKNASYDVVIPASALHTDADGSFVYTVAAKTSPLGNLYTVNRVGVEVIAYDDTHCAVTGELTTSDFVITTSAVPLQVGDRVRISG